MPLCCWTGPVALCSKPGARLGAALLATSCEFMGLNKCWLLFIHISKRFLLAHQMEFAKTDKRPMSQDLTHKEFSARGGKSRSAKKVEAVRENVKKAREAKKKAKQ